MLRKWLVALGLVFSVGLSASAAFTTQQPGQSQEPASAVEAVAGDWDGTVQLPDGPIPFFMKLKLENDQVSGEIGSDQGSTPVTGTWVEGKLSLAFTYVNGEAITMTGGLKDGQLSGDLSMNGGEYITTWTAKKKA